MMSVDDTGKQEYFLWRFTMPQPDHGMGFGCRAIEQFAEYVKMRLGTSRLRLAP